MNKNMVIFGSVLTFLIMPSFAQEVYSQEIQGPSLSVRMGFLGENNGDGTYSTKALSISVGAGRAGFHGVVLGNENSVVTAVGSGGNELIVQNGHDAGDQMFESNICTLLSDCTLLGSP